MLQSFSFFRTLSHNGDSLVEHAADPVLGDGRVADDKITAMVMVQFGKHFAQGLILDKQFAALPGGGDTGSQLSKAQTGRILKGLLNTIELTLGAGDTLTLVGFDTFDVKEQAERTGRNPQAGQEITIASAKLPSFKPSKALKDVINR